MRMKDRLEEFISDNRDRFDLHEPEEKLWAGIASKMRKRKKPRIGWKGILWRAAAVVIIFAASFTLQKYLHQRGTERMAGKREPAREIPELREAEIYYTNLLNEKISQIEPLLSDRPELKEGLTEDLSELDSVYAELQRDLYDNMANDKVVEAMIQNYILKIQILEDLLGYMNGNANNMEDENEQYEL